MHKVYLKPGKEDSLKRFHPWIFSGAIAHFDGEPEEGEVVEVYTSKKEFIAKGHFQIGSIAVRVLSFKQEEINHDFWKHKLEVVYDMRRSIGIATNPTNNTYRLVHGEGDNLPGLVIDVYARTAVMQAHSAGMHVDRMKPLPKLCPKLWVIRSKISIINQKRPSHLKQTFSRRTVSLKEEAATTSLRNMG